MQKGPRMADFQDVRNDYEEFWRFANNTWSPYIAEAGYDLRMYNGDAWTWEERQYLAQQGRNALEFNIVRPNVNFFSGYFIDNMTSAVAGPVENADQETADMLSELMLIIYDKGDADHINSLSVDHSFKVGMSLMGIYMDYSVDPVNGDIKFFWKSYNSFLLDPYFRNRDLSDCEQAILRDYISRDQAKILLPFLSPKEIDKLPTNIKDNKFLSLPERNKFFDNTDLLTYDQYYRRTSREVELLVDMQTGQSRELPKDKEIRDRVKAQAAFMPNLEVITRSKPSIELNILLSGQPVYSGPDPTGLDNFPFVANITYYDPDMSDYSVKLQGLVRSLRSCQREINKRNSKYIDTIDKNLYSGYFYKPSKLVDEEAIFQTGQGQNIPLKDNAEIGRDIQPIPAPQIPPGILEYSQSLTELSNRLIGVNEDMLGISKGGNNLVSGALAQIRASNGLRSNRGLFDNMEYSQKALANLVLQAIQINYSPAKVERMLGRQPTEQFYDKTFDNYDVQIIQTIKTQNQRYQYYADLMQGLSMGLDIPMDLVLENMPTQNRSDFLQRLQERQQQQEQQQMKVQEAEELLKKTQSAKAIGDIALAVERIARAEADQGLAKERISELQQNSAQATLDKVKAMKELETMDLDNALRTLQVIQALTQQDIASGQVQEKEQEQDAQQMFAALNAATESQQPQQQEVPDVTN